MRDRLSAHVRRSLVAAMTEMQRNKNGTVFDAYGRLSNQDDAGVSIPAGNAIAGDKLPDEYERLMAEVCEPGGEDALFKDNLPPHIFSSASRSDSASGLPAMSAQIIASAPHAQGSELPVADPAPRR